ncbi:MAG TPA: TIR domain-containing protein [Allosphingosinicella sp.]
MPTYTYVTPDKYSEIKVAVRTPGRCVVLEGPSGIGKTTIVTKVLEELRFESSPTVLSARRPQDVEIIAHLPEIKDFGIVVVDDFHRLSDTVKAQLSDFMKVLADTEDKGSQLVLIGINKAGEQLIQYGYDLGLRIDIFRLEANSPEKILELIRLGEEALNVSIAHREAVAERAGGSFQIAQLLCHKLCTHIGVTETAGERVSIDRSVDSVIEDVMVDLGRQFKRAAVAFARGTKIRREGRAPYLHILKWLSESDDGALDLREAMNAHPDMKGSVGQVVEKGFLKGLLNDPEKKNIFSNVLFYDPDTYVIGIEDPKFFFYLKNLVWRAFTRQCGFAGDYFRGKYDFALSFAGQDRPLVEELAGQLKEREISVFYDFDEQHQILGQNVEEYLSPIYRSEARYVVPFLSREFPKRIWTKFESDQFRERFGENSVFPIRFIDVEGGWFTDEGKHGGLAYDPAQDAVPQVEKIVETLAARLIEDREIAAAAEREEAAAAEA